MPSRKDSQNTPTFSTSATATAATVAPGPNSRPAAPDRIVVPIRPRPMTTISPKLRSNAQGKPGRRANGTSHTVLSAFWIVVATPRAPKNVPSRPTTSGSPVWVSGLIWPSCWPITG